MNMLGGDAFGPRNQVPWEMLGSYSGLEDLRE